MFVGFGLSLLSFSPGDRAQAAAEIKKAETALKNMKKNFKKAETSKMSIQGQKLISSTPVIWLTYCSR